jgi:hypothetical protein
MEIIFGEITEEKVNHAMPREFDAIMTWMGRALYPVCLTVDSSGKVNGQIIITICIYKDTCQI